MRNTFQSPEQDTLPMSTLSLNDSVSKADYGLLE